MVAEFKKDIDFIRVTQRASEGYQFLHRESDRGCVLIGGAMLDEILGALLLAFFVRDDSLTKKLLDLNAPSGVFLDPHSDLPSFESNHR